LFVLIVNTYVIVSLLFVLLLALPLCVLTADFLADYADSRRQKTGWSNGSAKADAADLADKDSYHTVGILHFTLFVVCCLSAI